MADENTSLEVEQFKAESGSWLMKYGDVLMRRPIFCLCSPRDYLRWLRDVKGCANDAGLLGHIEGTAIRPSAAGEQQSAFDKKRAAMNNFIYRSLNLGPHSGGKEEWIQTMWSLPQHLDAPPGTAPNFDTAETLRVLECAKDSVRSDNFFHEILRNPFHKKTDINGAIDELHYNWDNLKEFYPRLPDHAYVGMALSLAQWHGDDFFEELFLRTIPLVPSAHDIRRFLGEKLQQS
ncbi:hypothetical protein PLIIFM63780_009402 [Purpureocillium lilacinum]|uniref:uncharacterized protein n=1 Tax=Purpureocillium lilacinum TaxID=33203 RepID=UPI002081F76C|nr:hypothetical protein PLICBS_009489 [Purpureocillium lilacinum]GJN85828.1 hypothetical protein PLIIFM63780_009402 [Purpureocillium lilacinum]